MLSHLLKYFALDRDTKVNYELRQSQRSQVTCFRTRCWYLHIKLRKITQNHWGHCRNLQTVTATQALEWERLCRTNSTRRRKV